jgi:DnaJ-class molecular chaperone
LETAVLQHLFKRPGVRSLGHQPKEGIMSISVLNLRSCNRSGATSSSTSRKGLPVATQVAQVEKSLLRQVGKAVVSGEFAAVIGDGPQITPCEWCNGSGIEHTTQRVRNRFVDAVVRCRGCERRGAVAA